MCISKHRGASINTSMDTSATENEGADREEVTAGDQAYFKRMLDLIPRQFYFDRDAKEKLNAAKRPRAGNNSDDDEESVVEARGEWKRARFDPHALKTVTELQEHLVAMEDDSWQAGKKKTKRKKKVGGDSGGAEGGACSGPAGYSGLADLHERFQAKLREMKAKRKALGKGEFIMKRRLARKMGKLRVKINSNKEKSAPTKKPRSEKDKITTSKPVFNKDGNMVFSKFDFTQSEGRKKSEKTGKNYKNLLKKVEKQKEKEKRLEETDVSAAKTLKEKGQWQTVIQKAEGVKVRDDEQLLKKSIKRKEKLKKKSAKAWDQRRERTEKRMKEKQEKRKTNIKKKKEGRINKKINKSKKKGHIIPGF